MTLREESVVHTEGNFMLWTKKIGCHHWFAQLRANNILGVACGGIRST